MCGIHLRIIFLVSSWSPAANEALPRISFSIEAVLARKQENESEKNVWGYMGHP